jgi:hypothetical protein
MPNRLYDRRTLWLSVVLSMAAAAFFYFFGRYLGSGWNGFWLSLFGALCGQLVCMLILFRWPRLKAKDYPIPLCSWAGVGAMIALWLCLPEDLATTLSDIARPLTGAAYGIMAAPFVTGDYGRQLTSG